jgi:hypothetical protein
MKLHSSSNKKYVCAPKCEAVKASLKRVDEEHSEMQKLRKTGSFFKLPERLEFQEIYSLQALGQKYWDSLWKPSR